MLVGSLVVFYLLNIVREAQQSTTSICISRPIEFYSAIFDSMVLYLKFWPSYNRLFLARLLQCRFLVCFLRRQGFSVPSPRSSLVFLDMLVSVSEEGHSAFSGVAVTINEIRVRNDDLRDIFTGCVQCALHSLVGILFPSFIFLYILSHGVVW